MRPAPDALALTGSVTALLGYVLPWFRQQDGYLWSYSGWEFASLSNGGGWTLVTFGWLVLALGASLWAGRYPGAALTVLVGGVAALFFSLAVVAASFSNVPDRSNLAVAGRARSVAARATSRQSLSVSDTTAGPPRGTGTRDDL
jgi:hypothetical protein